MKPTTAFPVRAVLVLVVLIVGVTAVWLATQQGGTTAVTVAKPVESRQEHRRPVATIPALATERAVLQAAPVELDEPARDTPANTAALRTDGPVLTGRVVVVGTDGTERHDLDGELTLILWVGNSGRNVDVPIEGGAFRLVLERVGDDDARMTYAGQRFDPDVLAAAIEPRVPRFDGYDRAVVLVEPATRYAFGDEDVEVRLREVSTILLFVEDQDSGAALQDVTVVLSPDWTIDDMAHPGNVDAAVALVSHGVSPVEIQPTSQQASRGNLACFVHSPGYAWSAVELDVSRGGERRVRLQRGGDLEVLLTRPVERPGVRLRLRAQDGESRPRFDLPVTDQDSILIEGLAPGVFTLVVELGDWWDDPVVLARREVELVSGTRVQVQIALDESPEFETAPLSGQLIVPQGWPRAFYLAFELLETPLDGTDGRHVLYWRDFTSLSPETYAWDLGLVQVGSYKLTFSAAEYAITIDVGPAGRNDVVLEVPPPAVVTLFVKDQRTGEPADIDRLLWNCKRPPGVTGGGLEHADRDPTTSAYLLRVPQGTEIEVMNTDFSYEPISTSFTAEDGLELTLETRRISAVQVELRDGDTTVPWPPDDYGNAEHLDGDGAMGIRGRQGSGLRFTVTEPGRYRVQIPTLPGFEAHDPVVVDVAEGETLEVVIPLTRAR